MVSSRSSSGTPAVRGAGPMKSPGSGGPRATSAAAAELAEQLLGPLSVIGSPDPRPPRSSSHTHPHPTPPVARALLQTPGHGSPGGLGEVRTVKRPTIGAASHDRAGSHGPPPKGRSPSARQLPNGRSTAALELPPSGGPGSLPQPHRLPSTDTRPQGLPPSVPSRHSEEPLPTLRSPVPLYDPRPSVDRAAPVDRRSRGRAPEHTARPQQEYLAQPPQPHGARRSTSSDRQRVADPEAEAAAQELLETIGLLHRFGLPPPGAAPAHAPRPPPGPRPSARQPARAVENEEHERPPAPEPELAPAPVSAPAYHSPHPEAPAHPHDQIPARRRSDANGAAPPNMGRSLAEDGAAATVQRAWRGASGRTAAAARATAVADSVAARTAAESEAEMTAVVVIQAFLRARPLRLPSRSDPAREGRAASAIQTQWRGHQGRATVRARSAESEAAAAGRESAERAAEDAAALALEAHVRARISASIAATAALVRDLADVADSERRDRARTLSEEAIDRAGVEQAAAREKGGVARNDGARQLQRLWRGHRGRHAGSTARAAAEAACEQRTVAEGTQDTTALVLLQAALRMRGTRFNTALREEELCRRVARAAEAAARSILHGAHADLRAAVATTRPALQTEPTDDNADGGDRVESDDGRRHTAALVITRTLRRAGAAKTVASRRGAASDEERRRVEAEVEWDAQQQPEPEGHAEQDTVDVMPETAAGADRRVGIVQRRWRCRAAARYVSQRAVDARRIDDARIALEAASPAQDAAAVDRHEVSDHEPEAAPPEVPDRKSGGDNEVRGAMAMQRVWGHRARSREVFPARAAVAADTAAREASERIDTEETSAIVEGTAPSPALDPSTEEEEARRRQGLQYAEFTERDLIRAQCALSAATSALSLEAATDAATAAVESHHRGRAAQVVQSQWRGHKGRAAGGSKRSASAEADDRRCAMEAASEHRTAALVQGALRSKAAVADAVARRTKDAVALLEGTERSARYALLCEEVAAVDAMTHRTRDVRVDIAETAGAIAMQRLWRGHDARRNTADTRAAASRSVDGRIDAEGAQEAAAATAVQSSARAVVSQREVGAQVCRAFHRQRVEAGEAEARHRAAVADAEGAERRLVIFDELGLRGEVAVRTAVSKAALDTAMEGAAEATVQAYRGEAAVAVQSAWRGHGGRTTHSRSASPTREAIDARCEAEAALERDAATTVQAAARAALSGHAARHMSRRVEERAAVDAAESDGRGALLREETEGRGRVAATVRATHPERRGRGAVAIQATWRGHTARGAGAQRRSASREAEDRRVAAEAEWEQSAVALLQAAVRSKAQVFEKHRRERHAVVAAEAEHRAVLGTAEAAVAQLALQEERDERASPRNAAPQNRSPPPRRQSLGADPGPSLRRQVSFSPQAMARADEDPCEGSHRRLVSPPPGSPVSPTAVGRHFPEAEAEVVSEKDSEEETPEVQPAIAVSEVKEVLTSSASLAVPQGSSFRNAPGAGPRKRVSFSVAGGGEGLMDGGSAARSIQRTWRAHTARRSVARRAESVMAAVAAREAEELGGACQGGASAGAGLLGPGLEAAHGRKRVSFSVADEVTGAEGTKRPHSPPPAETPASPTSAEHHAPVGDLGSGAEADDGRPAKVSAATMGRPRASSLRHSASAGGHRVSFSSPAAEASRAAAAGTIQRGWRGHAARGAVSQRSAAVDAALTHRTAEESAPRPPPSDDAAAPPPAAPCPDAAVPRMDPDHDPFQPRPFDPAGYTFPVATPPPETPPRRRSSLPEAESLVVAKARHAVVREVLDTVFGDHGSKRAHLGTTPTATPRSRDRQRSDAPSFAAGTEDRFCGAAEPESPFTPRRASRASASATSVPQSSRPSSASQQEAAEALVITNARRSVVKEVADAVFGRKEAEFAEALQREAPRPRRRRSSRLSSTAHEEHVEQETIDRAEPSPPRRRSRLASRSGATLREELQQALAAAPQRPERPASDEEMETLQPSASSRMNPRRRLSMSALVKEDTTVDYNATPSPAPSPDEPEQVRPEAARLRRRRSSRLSTTAHEEHHAEREASEGETMETLQPSPAAKPRRRASLSAAAKEDPTADFNSRHDPEVMSPDPARLRRRRSSRLSTTAHEEHHAEEERMDAVEAAPPRRRSRLASRSGATLREELQQALAAAPQRPERPASDEEMETLRPSASSRMNPRRRLSMSALVKEDTTVDYNASPSPAPSPDEPEQVRPEAARLRRRRSSRLTTTAHEEHHAEREASEGETMETLQPSPAAKPRRRASLSAAAKEDPTADFNSRHDPEVMSPDPARLRRRRSSRLSTTAHEEHQARASSRDEAVESLQPSPPAKPRRRLSLSAIAKEDSTVDYGHGAGPGKQDDVSRRSSRSSRVRRVSLFGPTPDEEPVAAHTASRTGSASRLKGSTTPPDRGLEEHQVLRHRTASLEPMYPALEAVLAAATRHGAPPIPGLLCLARAVDGDEVEVADQERNYAAAAVQRGWESRQARAEAQDPVRAAAVVRTAQSVQAEGTASQQEQAHAAAIVQRSWRRCKARSAADAQLGAQAVPWSAIYTPGPAHDGSPMDEGALDPQAGEEPGEQEPTEQVREPDEDEETRVIGRMDMSLLQSSPTLALEARERARRGFLENRAACDLQQALESFAAPSATGGAEAPTTRTERRTSAEDNAPTSPAVRVSPVPNYGDTGRALYPPVYDQDQDEEQGPEESAPSPVAAAARESSDEAADFEAPVEQEPSFTAAPASRGTSVAVAREVHHPTPPPAMPVARRLRQTADDSATESDAGETTVIVDDLSDPDAIATAAAAVGAVAAVSVEEELRCLEEEHERHLTPAWRRGQAKRRAVKAIVKEATVQRQCLVEVAADSSRGLPPLLLLDDVIDGLRGLAARQLHREQHHPVDALPYSAISVERAAVYLRLIVARVDAPPSPAAEITPSVASAHVVHAIVTAASGTGGAASSPLAPHSAVTLGTVSAAPGVLEPDVFTREVLGAVRAAHLKGHGAPAHMQRQQWARNAFAVLDLHRARSAPRALCERVLGRPVPSAAHAADAELGVYEDLSPEPATPYRPRPPSATSRRPGSAQSSTVVTRPASALTTVRRSPEVVEFSAFSAVVADFTDSDLSAATSRLEGLLMDIGASAPAAVRKQWERMTRGAARRAAHCAKGLEEVDVAAAAEDLESKPLRPAERLVVALALQALGINTTAEMAQTTLAAELRCGSLPARMRAHRWPALAPETAAAVDAHLRAAIGPSYGGTAGSDAVFHVRHWVYNAVDLAAAELHWPELTPHRATPCPETEQFVPPEEPVTPPRSARRPSLMTPVAAGVLSTKPSAAIPHRLAYSPGAQPRDDLPAVAVEVRASAERGGAPSPAVAASPARSVVAVTAPLQRPPSLMSPRVQRLVAAASTRSDEALLHPQPAPVPALMTPRPPPSRPISTRVLPLPASLTPRPRRAVR